MRVIFDLFITEVFLHRRCFRNYWSQYSFSFHLFKKSERTVDWDTNLTCLILTFPECIVILTKIPVFPHELLQVNTVSTYDAKMKGDTHFGKDENLLLKNGYFHVHFNFDFKKKTRESILPAGGISLVGCPQQRKWDL